MLRLRRSTPRPLHPWQGCEITRPLPPHVPQVSTLMNLANPEALTFWTSPAPRQRGQTVGSVPGFAPVPPQVLHRSVRGTSILALMPWAACSRVSSRSYRRSVPRAGPLGLPPNPRKRVSKRSPNPPNPDPRSLKISSKLAPRKMSSAASRPALLRAPRTAALAARWSFLFGRLGCGLLVHRGSNLLQHFGQRIMLLFEFDEVLACKRLPQ